MFSPAIMAVLSQSSTVAPGGDEVAGSDDFAGDESKWADDANNFTVGSGVYASSTTAGQTRYTATMVTPNQWACVNITDLTTNGIWDGLLLRSEGAAAGNKGYVVAYRSANTSIYVAKVVAGAIDDWSILGASQELAFADGNYLCASVTGTGASTVVKVWKKTSAPGDGPSAWGAADLTFNGGSAASNADSGVYCGLWSNGTANSFDDFKFGIWTP